MRAIASQAVPLHETLPRNHRFHLLDAMRGVVALLVVCFHAPYPYAPAFARYSFLAVDFFFCLSGFVIAFSYERRLSQGYGFIKFIQIRIIRLYPIYFLGIFMGASILLLTYTHAVPSTSSRSSLLFAFLLQLLMMPGAAHHGDWLFPLDFPAWSIFYEIIANVFFAALVVRSLAKTQILMGIVLLSCCFLLIWLSINHSLNVGALLGYSALVAVARLMLSFFNGVLVYRLFARLTTALWTPVRSAWVGLLTVALLALLLTNFLHLTQTRVGQFIIIAALYPAILYVGARCRVASSWALPCALLGELSYPLYLLHAHFMQCLASFTASGYNHHHHAQGLMLSLTIAAAVATSFAASRLYDIPVRSAVLRFINNRSQITHTQS